MSGCRIAWLLAGLLLPEIGRAAPLREFSAHFENCTEFVGWGPIDLTAAGPLVPAGYRIAGGSTGQAAIVVRATNCGSVQVQGTPAMPTRLSQIGINLVSPDGTGDINNYTLVYVSNNPFLVGAFLLAGVPARYDAQIAYEFTASGKPGTGELYAAAAPADRPAWFFHGTETDPAPGSEQLFLANWWFGANAAVKQATVFPRIGFGTASVTFFTSRDSELGTLIRGNTDSDFDILSVRGVYASADLKVSVGRH